MTLAARLAPFDLVLALRLSADAGTLIQLADELAVVPSQVHAGLRRLALAGLLRPGTRSANTRALLEFLVHGVRYAFPATKGQIASGLPTAYSAPPLSAVVDAVDVVVWPAPNHPEAVQGFTLTPLYRKAPELLARSPRTYQLVALADAFRLADPRTRLSARDAAERLLAAPA